MSINALESNSHSLWMRGLMDMFAAAAQFTNNTLKITHLIINQISVRHHLKPTWCRVHRKEHAVKYIKARSYCWWSGPWCRTERERCAAWALTGNLFYAQLIGFYGWRTGTVTCVSESFVASLRIQNNKIHVMLPDAAQHRIPESTDWLKAAPSFIHTGHITFFYIIAEHFFQRTVNWACRRIPESSRM